mgnify:CR=1 FL=1
MTLTEGLLIAVIMILTIYVFTKNNKQAEAPVENFKLNDNLIPLSPVMRKTTPEQKAIMENTEYFDGSNIASMSAEMHGEGAISQNSEQFLNPLTSFKDYVMGQAVDASVVKNHQEFVKDRLGENSQFIVGKTMALPDLQDNLGYGTNWVGLRKPQGVAVDDNVSSVNDINPLNYANKPTFSWNSR